MQLSAIQQDALTEIANISFGKAASALSVLMEEQVNTNVPCFQLKTVETASDAIGLADELVTEIVLKIKGDVTGIILILMQPAVAQELEKILNEVGVSSALPELGNILAGNALTAISKFLNLTLISSVPDIATDMQRALIVSSVFQLGEETDAVLLLSAQMSLSKTQLSARIYFLFDEVSTQKIIEVIPKS